MEQGGEIFTIGRVVLLDGGNCYHPQANSVTYLVLCIPLLEVPSNDTHELNQVMIDNDDITGIFLYSGD